MNTWQFCCGAYLLFLSALSPGQTPAALRNLTASYELQRTTLASTLEAQLKPARDRYLATLGAAHKTALSATRTTDIAAINAEIEAVNSGALPEPAPPDLPRNLLADRRALVSAFTNTARTLIPRQRELALTYQRNLNALEETARRSKDQVLLEAISAEKQRAFAEVESTGGGQKNRNVIENGDFSAAPGGGSPAGWIKANSWKDVNDANVVTEGRDKFLRFRRLQAAQQSDLKPEKVIPIPARARAAEVAFRMRVEGLVKGTRYDPWPGAHISARDARDESLAKEEAVLKADSTWRRMTARVDLPEGTKSLRVTLGPFGAAGIIDFDDVSVEFK